MNKKKPAERTGLVRSDLLPPAAAAAIAGATDSDGNLGSVVERPDSGGSVANRKIYRAASLMVRHHGIDALTRAVERLEELRGPGYEDEQAVWLRMVVAIARMLDHEKPDGAAIH